MASEVDFDEPYMTQKIGHVTIFSFYIDLSVRAWTCGSLSSSAIIIYLLVIINLSQWVASMNRTLLKYSGQYGPKRNDEGLLLKPRSERRISRNDARSDISDL